MNRASMLCLPPGTLHSLEQRLMSTLRYSLSTCILAVQPLYNNNHWGLNATRRCAEVAIVEMSQWEEKVLIDTWLLREIPGSFGRV